MTYKILKGNVMAGHGQNFQLNNKYSAEQLCTTLNKLLVYEVTARETDMVLDKLTRQVIQSQMSLKILEDDIRKMRECLK